MRSFFKCTLPLLLLSAITVAASSSETATFRPRSALTTQKTRSALLPEKTELKLPTNDVLTVRRGGVVAAKNTLPKALAGAVVFAAIEKMVKMGLVAADVKYPAQLGACILLFVVMCLTDVVAPVAANKLFTALTPGAGILAKWLPVFFVPGLTMLPLSPPIGGAVDILKVLLTVSIGFVFSMSSTLFSVTVMRSLQGRSPPPSSAVTKKVTTTVTGPRPKTFSDEQWKFCWRSSVVSGLISIAATKSGNALASPLQTIFTLVLTVACYIWGTRLPVGFNKLVHPLVTSSVLMLAMFRGLAAVTGKEFLKVLATYKAGTLDPMKVGAGDCLLFLLGPTVVSFAVSVYSRKSLLFRNLPMVLTAMLVSSAGGLFATGTFVRAIQLGGKSGASSALVRLSVLGRSITTALAMALTDMVGGDLSIVAAICCLTGILGASYGVMLLDALGIKDPICRGLGIGSCAQGLGVAAIAGEPDAFAFASVAMVLTAVSATTLVSFPAFRSALIRVTTGQTP